MFVFFATACALAGGGSLACVLLCLLLAMAMLLFSQSMSHSKAVVVVVVEAVIPSTCGLCVYHISFLLSLGNASNVMIKVHKTKRWMVVITSVGDNMRVCVA